MKPHSKRQEKRRFQRLGSHAVYSHSLYYIVQYYGYRGNYSNVYNVFRSAVVLKAMHIVMVGYEMVENFKQNNAGENSQEHKYNIIISDVFQGFGNQFHN